MEEFEFVNGTSYHKDTPYAAISVLERARKEKIRIRIFYGDKETGKDWMEWFDTIGLIGRSNGNIKVPILLKNKNSFGGGAILDNAIVKITIDKKTVYKHPKYYLPELKIVEAKGSDEGYSVLADGKSIANCKYFQESTNIVAYLQGYRNRA